MDIGAKWLTLVLVLSLVVFFKNVDGSFGLKMKDCRLPLNVEPREYDIFMDPHFENFTFSGKVRIVADVTKNFTRIITIHSVKLNISSAAVYVNNKKIDLDVTVRTDEEREFLHLDINHDLMDTDKLQIIIGFSGILNEEPRGFYRGYYETEDGEKRWFAVTRFHPNYARYAFPCFDEPAMKAIFKLIIRRPKDMMSLSTTKRLITTYENAEFRRDYFTESHLLSTYTFGFIICDFWAVRGINTEIYASEEHILDNRADVALRLSENIKLQMTITTGLTCSFDLYHISIPEDFSLVAAVQYGSLMIYKDRFLLCDTNQASVQDQYKIASAMTHLMTNLWFGYLVTPKWWTHLWLTEGFATYYQYLVTRELERDWPDMFVVEIMHRTFDNDVYSSTRPMFQEPYYPNQISSLLDHITSHKSAAIVRMMHHFLTGRVFFNSVNTFLKRYMYRPVTEYDLFRIIHEKNTKNENGVQLPKHVTRIMKTWTMQKGYPVVYVSITPNGYILFQQSGFKHTYSPIDDGTWYIPITYATASDPSFENTETNFWLTKRSRLVYHIILSPNDWLIVNKQQVGYYRVYYDRLLWEMIIDGLDSDDYDKIHPINRAQLINDVFTFAMYWTGDFEVPLRLIKFLEREKEYIVWYSFCRVLEEIDHKLQDLPNYSHFSSYVISLLTPRYKKLGLEDVGNSQNKLLREMILYWMCKFGIEECLDNMNILLWNASSIPPDLREVVYCTGMMGGGMHEVGILKDIYQNRNLDHEIRLKALRGLGCNQNRYVLSQIIAASAFIQDSHKEIFYMSMITTDEGIETLLDYLSLVFDIPPLPDDMFKKVVEKLANRLFKQHHIEIMEDILNSNRMRRSDNFIDEMLNILTNNKKWMYDNYHLFSSFVDYEEFMYYVKWGLVIIIYVGTVIIGIFLKCCIDVLALNP